MSRSKIIAACSDTSAEDDNSHLSQNHGSPNTSKQELCVRGLGNIYLVLELCTGGELFDRIIEYGHLTEKQAGAKSLVHLDFPEGSGSIANVSLAGSTADADSLPQDAWKLTAECVACVLSCRTFATQWA